MCAFNRVLSVLRLGSGMMRLTLILVSIERRMEKKRTLSGVVLYKGRFTKEFLYPCSTFRVNSGAIVIPIYNRQFPLRLVKNPFFTTSQ
ncbi:hypothetical protein CEXT_394821 [Caerostris extrusa]|uniref:Secreted protein n=1 Tax=Caerostris extrusa TaxID=172846 RepID=A0AAV4XBU0_CAEEX|nr:hypothetical protein CEXT_394821 [Caerostris extrusa]